MMKLVVVAFPGYPEVVVPVFSEDVVSKSGIDNVKLIVMPDGKLMLVGKSTFSRFHVEVHPSALEDKGIESPWP